MRIHFLILTMLLAVIVRPAGPQQAPEPLTKSQVMDLVKAGMETPELVKLIRGHGVDFDLTDDCLQALRSAGAQEAVIQALRAARPKPLSKEQVLQLVAGHVPSERTATLVRQHGIDFVADEAYFDTLRLAGGTDQLISALREASKALAAGQAHMNPKDNLKYVWIPPGTFMMGCSPGDVECLDAEKPAHQVTLTRGFWIGQTPVTVAAYKRFAAATGRQMPDAPGFNSGWGNEAMPIVNVTWGDARAYCTWAGGRLPTEAEWEYAARGGSAEARYGPVDDIAWYHGNSGGQTHDVAQKRANGFGLYDMLGNVWEWVNDWYDENYYQSSPSEDPQGPAGGGQTRVLRGGSWSTLPGDVRVSYRLRFGPSYWSDFHGFRCGGEVVNP
jgi:formylglycine-generating enzyme required for sulfatase activity